MPPNGDPDSPSTSTKFRIESCIFQVILVRRPFQADLTLPPAGSAILARFLSGSEGLTYIMTKNAFLDAARKYEKPMVKFLREMIAIPSESAEEGPVIERIKKEMESTGAF